MSNVLKVTKYKLDMPSVGYEVGHEGIWIVYDGRIIGIESKKKMLVSIKEWAMWNLRQGEHLGSYCGNLNECIRNGLVPEWLKQVNIYSWQYLMRNKREGKNVLRFLVEDSGRLRRC